MTIIFVGISALKQYNYRFVDLKSANVLSYLSIDARSAVQVKQRFIMCKEVVAYLFLYVYVFKVLRVIFVGTEREVQFLFNSSVS